MKDQVSVIKFGIGKSNEVEEVILPIEEYERLKRLDENRKAKIAELKEIDGESTPSGLVKLLESLDK